MKKYQATLASLLTCCAIAAPSLVSAETHRSNYYWPHHHAMTAPLEVRNYNDYEAREPCQMYKALPNDLKSQGTRCIAGTNTEVTKGFVLLPIIATYTIYFDFDKSTMRQDQHKVIEQLISEINTYHPSQITVTGHTDTAGAADYNQVLSGKRADTVSKVLSTYNVSSFYLNESALGEQNLAVPTPDNTELSSNRRVVVQFRK